MRYIHLNPLRARSEKSLAQRDCYRWSGHRVLMDKLKNDWQDRDYVLKWFGKKVINKTAKDAERAVRIGAEVLLQKSKENVPHDKGILENSGSVDSQLNPIQATT